MMRARHLAADQARRTPLVSVSWPAEHPPLDDIDDGFILRRQTETRAELWAAVAMIMVAAGACALLALAMIWGVKTLVAGVVA